MNILTPVADKDSVFSSTYGGNPLCCAAALAAIDVYEREGLAERANETGRWMADRFRSLQEKSRYLGDVRGMGLVFGAILLLWLMMVPLTTPQK